MYAENHEALSHKFFKTLFFKKSLVAYSVVFHVANVIVLKEICIAFDPFYLSVLVNTVHGFFGYNTRSLFLSLFLPNVVVFEKLSIIYIDKIFFLKYGQILET